MRYTSQQNQFQPGECWRWGHAAYMGVVRVRSYVLPSAKRIFVVGWTGMRGVVALAAAIALPETLADGRPLPERNLIIFLTFSVILVTLVLQGLTLPPLIRALGLAGTANNNTEEEEARRILTSTALAHLEAAREQNL